MMKAKALLKHLGMPFRAWKQTYSYRSIIKRLGHSRTQLPVAIPTNLGYRFYAHHLHNYYNCDWMLETMRWQPPEPAHRAVTNAAANSGANH